MFDAAFLWPQSRKASGPRVVLSADHLNAANSAARQRHHTKGKGRRATDLCSVPSFSLENHALTRWRESILFGTLLLFAGHAMNLDCRRVRVPHTPLLRVGLGLPSLHS
jgi:hypothetical protein